MSVISKLEDKLLDDGLSRRRSLKRPKADDVVIFKTSA